LRLQGPKSLDVEQAQRYAKAEADREYGETIESCQAHEVFPPSLLFDRQSSNRSAMLTIALKG